MRRRQAAGLLLALLVSLNAPSAKAGAAQTTLDRESPAVRKSSTELGDAALVRSEPEYPALAKAARVSGTVEVELALDLEGNVKRAHAISGHPLLKDSAVAAARQWKFDLAKLSSAPAPVVGTLTFFFDLASEERKEKRSEEDRVEEDKNWAANLRICREQIDRQSPDNRNLARALAKLSVAALDEDRVEKALKMFDDVERRDKLPAEARPYHARLFVEKYNYDLERAIKLGEDPSSARGSLYSALQLFFDSYYEELASKPIEMVRLVDIGRYIARVYQSLGKNEEALDWFKKMLNEPGFSDAVRAEISYNLGVQYWKKAYDLIHLYSRENQPVPDTDLPAIRAWVAEGYFHIHTAESLAPGYANAWFYEKLLVVLEIQIEADAEKKKVFDQRARELQDRFLTLLNLKAGADSFGNGGKPFYASGLPSLNSGPTFPAPPPPPPPPPPSPAKQQ